jgi:hypothetical protein
MPVARIIARTAPRICFRRLSGMKQKRDAWKQAPGLNTLNVLRAIFHLL